MPNNIDRLKSTVLKIGNQIKESQILREVADDIKSPKDEPDVVLSGTEIFNAIKTKSEEAESEKNTPIFNESIFDLDIDSLNSESADNLDLPDFKDEDLEVSFDDPNFDDNVNLNLQISNNDGNEQDDYVHFGDDEDLANAENEEEKTEGSNDLQAEQIETPTEAEIVDETEDVSGDISDFNLEDISEFDLGKEADNIEEASPVYDVEDSSFKDFDSSVLDEDESYKDGELDSTLDSNETVNLSDIENGLFRDDIIDLDEEDEPEVDESALDELVYDDALTLEDEIADEDIEGEFDKKFEEIVPHFQISEEQFRVFLENLNALPLRLKQEVENIIMSGTKDQNFVIALISSVIEGASPHVISKQIQRNTDLLIEIPASYKKISQKEYQRMLSSFPYRFKNEAYPFIRLIFVSSLLFLFTFTVIFKYAFKPLYSEHLYKKGILKINQEDFLNAEEIFHYAYSIYPDKDQFIKYATAYEEKRKYDNAYSKYIELLGDIREDEAIGNYSQSYDPLYENGILHFANFLTFNYSLDNDRNYYLALEYLKRIIRRDNRNYNALLMTAKVYFELGDNVVIPDYELDTSLEERIKIEKLIKAQINFKNAQYEKGREAISNIDKLKVTKELEQFAMRYYVRKDNYSKLKLLKNDIMPTLSSKEIDKTSFLEVIDYLMKRNNIQDAIEANRMIDMLIPRNLANPEVNYYKSKYFNIQNNLKAEKFYLEKTISLFEETKKNVSSLNKKESRMEMFSLLRFGEILMKEKDVERAKELFMKTANLYEDALSKKAMQRDAELGKVYEKIGDIYYSQNNLELAKINYLISLENKNNTSNINYKIGYIDYENGNYKEARLSFLKVQNNIEEQPFTNDILIFAQANSSFFNENYEDAIALYKVVLDNLNKLIDSKAYFNPKANPMDKNALMMQIKVLNNLGISVLKLYDLHSINPNSINKEEGLYYLEKAHQKIADFNRNENTLASPQEYFTPSSNLQKYIKSYKNSELVVYNEIYKYLDQRDF